MIACAARSLTYRAVCNSVTMRVSVSAGWVIRSAGRSVRGRARVATSTADANPVIRMPMTAMLTANSARVMLRALLGLAVMVAYFAGIASPLTSPTGGKLSATVTRPVSAATETDRQKLPAWIRTVPSLSGTP